MNDTAKIGIAAVLLAVGAAMLVWASLDPSGTTTLLAVAAVATTLLAAGSLLMGSTGTDGRMV
ncbi:hypothetical protein [Halobacterium sp. CBA1126]|uniref:hypothetical protein n=1 Tax=Halobacterium TaxID=2239 RepID=UPI0012F8BE6F|nr:hypothetical protein [Halobacterium sp. CBA1126]MUV61475.1 hypothetical protein [Halobacterium sp. CBA1126]